MNKIIYIFVDEAGDMDFSAKGSKYYMFNFLIKSRPFRLHEYLIGIDDVMTSGREINHYEK